MRRIIMPSWLLRDVIKNRRTYDVDKRWMAVDKDGNVRPASDSDKITMINPKDPTLPAIIRDLKPSWIEADDERVTIELLGGFDHCGVHAFVNPDRGHGDKKLLDGLWYYSDQ